MKNIKPIETHYAGYHFRSRLEARWAVAFDNSHLFTRWEYEPQGFSTPHDPYLPDFRIWWTNIEYSWVKVKPEGYQPTVQEHRIYQAMAGTPYTPSARCCGLYLLRGIGPGYRFYRADGQSNEMTDAFVEEHALVTGRSARFEHGQSGS